MDSADTVFVAWGSTKGPVIEAQKLLDSQGKKTACVHFTHLYPLKKIAITPFFPRGKRYILVENNSRGQFGKLLLAETGIDIKEKLLKYDGRPFRREEIFNFINSKNQ